MLPRSYPLAQTKELVGELLAIVCENGANADRTGALNITQEAAGIGRRLVVLDTDKDPAGGLINRNAQITARGLVLHLRKVLHVNVDVSRLVCLEAAVLGAGVLYLQIAQVAHAMTTQATIKP